MAIRELNWLWKWFDYFPTQRYELVKVVQPVVEVSASWPIELRQQNTSLAVGAGTNTILNMHNPPDSDLARQYPNALIHRLWIYLWLQSTAPAGFARIDFAVNSQANAVPIVQAPLGDVNTGRAMIGGYTAATGATTVSGGLAKPVYVRSPDTCQLIVTSQVGTETVISRGIYLEALAEVPLVYPFTT